MSRLPIVVGLSFIVAACKGGGTGGEGEPCGPSGECDPGLECDLVNNICVQRGGSDAGVDALALDAGPLDSPPGVPDTVIDAQPATFTQSTTATIEFHGTLAGSTFQCSLDGGPFAPCTSPASFSSLLEGEHTVLVKAVVGSMEDPIPSAITWTVDFTDPVVEISSPTASASTCASTVVAFDTNPAADVVTYTCSVDGGAAQACAEPSATFTLAGGPHTVRVTATDQAGNSAFQDVAFTVDVTGPTMTIGTVAPGGVNSGAATVPFSANEQLMAFGAGLVLLDATGASLLQPGCTCVPGSCACGGLAPGGNQISLRGMDLCGNIGAAATTIVTAPFGPYDGHAVLIGDDFASGALPGAVLANAVTLAPVRHRALDPRPVRVLGWRGALAAGDATKDQALAALEANVPGFDRAVPAVYVEFTNTFDMPGLLRGRDVLLVFDQKDVQSAAALDGVGTTWNGTLGPFLAAGGVVVVLSATTTDGSAASETWRVLGGGGNPVLALSSAYNAPLGSQGGTADIYVRYPAGTLGGPSFWLARNVSPPFPTTDHNACFSPAAAESASSVYLDLSYACGDGCSTYLCPVVADKVFPEYALSPNVPQLPGNTVPGVSGTMGTGTFTVPGGVPRSGFNCYVHQSPGYLNDPTAIVPCTITGPGTFSFSVAEGDWHTAVITLLDADGEPAQSAEIEWYVDNYIFVGAYTPSTNDRVIAYIANEYPPPQVPQPPFYRPYASSSCYLEWYNPFNGQYVQVGLTRQNEGCGATPNPSGGYDNNQPLVDWTAEINSTGNGTYRTTFTASDFYGNSGTASTQWDVFNAGLL